MWNEQSAQRLGVAIRRYRTERGLSQETLAHQAGITKNQLQLIEAGRSSGRAAGLGPSNPRLATLTGIASAFDVSVSQLLAEASI